MRSNLQLRQQLFALQSNLSPVSTYFPANLMVCFAPSKTAQKLLLARRQDQHRRLRPSIDAPLLLKTRDEWKPNKNRSEALSRTPAMQFVPTKSVGNRSLPIVLMALALFWAG
jgi:hypothetical protein